MAVCSEEVLRDETKMAGERLKTSQITAKTGRNFLSLHLSDLAFV